MVLKIVQAVSGQSVHHSVTVDTSFITDKKAHLDFLECKSSLAIERQFLLSPSCPIMIGMKSQITSQCEALSIKHALGNLKIC